MYLSLCCFQLTIYQNESADYHIEFYVLPSVPTFLELVLYYSVLLYINVVRNKQTSTSGFIL